MACNRDEQRSRPPAEPPRARSFAGVRTVMPIDPISGGTWIGVNEHGLALTLLNRNDEQYPARGERSRGEVIPLLIDASSIDEVERRLAELEGLQFGPFRLVAVDAEGQGVIWANRPAIGRDRIWKAHDLPVCFTSSSLGDALVDLPRLELFAEWFADEASRTPAHQDAFHAHRWPEHPELSVNMSRDDAESVSSTAVEIEEHTATLTYHGGPPGLGVEPVTCELHRADVERV